MKSWRSLDALAERPEYQEYLHREFSEGASELDDAVSRRNFLKLMGASLALAGMNACTRQPVEQIVPYVKQPEEIIPGRPLFYATSFLHGGFAQGILVESHEGRPTKIEGNPDHPASLGATSTFAQAAILELYDPDRSQAVTQGNEISTWTAFTEALGSEVEALRTSGGDGLRILTGTVTSPTLAAQIKQITDALPKARWHQWEPLHRDRVKEGARQAFGEAVETHYRFEQAKVVVAFDSDFLSTHPASLRHVRDFADARRVAAGGKSMNRLYVLEPTPTTTGAMADHRLALSPEAIESFAHELADALSGKASANPRIAALAAELEQARGASIILAGETAPAAVHALAHAMNSELDNLGKTIVHAPSAEANPVDQLQSLRELTSDLQTGRVEVLLILGGNPAYDAPADLDFATALGRVKLSAHLSLYADETSALCRWHVPAAHFLEMWGDARAFDGTASLIQPLIAPLYGGKSAHELLAGVLGQPGVTGYEVVREHWRTAGQWPDFEKGWRRALHDGVIAGSAFPAKTVTLKAGVPPAAASKEGSRLLFRADPSVWDGRYANNAWLQELPRPLTKITWDNAALLSVSYARQLGVENGDLVELRSGGRSLRAPVWIAPGQADGLVVLHLGNGRTRAGKVGNGAGFDAGSLRTAEALCGTSDLQIDKVAGRHLLAHTQDHHTLDGRDYLRSGTLTDYLEKPERAEEPGPEETLYHPEEHYHEGYAWGMAIDLNTCMGCNACVIACQAENNIPVVGKDQVSRAREMHWIRIDTYYSGSPEAPEINHQPVPCMHCENAPCELVCPVAATVHSVEGLNEQVYNRCIGTRYCSNNCPYKVRRFNFLEYTDSRTPSLKLGRNPNVTVRTRGVMEKCTYCVQRINAVRLDAKKENRPIRDGEITPACAQACAAQAIVFGDIHDPQSRVTKLKNSPLSYAMLAELNTRPRTTYLNKLRNPNPDWPA